VYGLFYNEENICFYVGKGSGNRCETHFCDYMKGENLIKDEKIESLRKKGKEPFAIKLITNLKEDIILKSLC